MHDVDQGPLLPDWLQQALSLALTVLAALLYAAVLGMAIVRTIVEGDPTFPENTVRAAGLLSGLVGAVVTAGFARSRRPEAVPIIAPHPVAGNARTGWYTLRPPSRARRKLLGLAATLGMRLRADDAEGPIGLPVPPSPEEPSEGERRPEPSPSAPASSAAVWVALLYFGVYFVIGVSALLLALWRETVPDLIMNAAWVWLGTVVSAAYSFFALDTR